jgi:hypothetical protein
MSTFQRDETALESIIDRQGLTVVLGMIANICTLKAAHIAEAWQDHRLAKKWQSASRRLDTAANWAGEMGPQ